MTVSDTSLQPVSGVTVSATGSPASASSLSAVTEPFSKLPMMISYVGIGAVVNVADTVTFDHGITKELPVTSTSLFEAFFTVSVSRM